MMFALGGEFIILFIHTEACSGKYEFSYNLHCAVPWRPNTGKGSRFVYDCSHQPCEAI